MKLVFQVLGIDITKKEIRSIQYSKIVTAADADADGMHIRGLLLSAFRKYVPWIIEQGSIVDLKTPIICLHDKKGKIKHYFFSIQEFSIFCESHNVDLYVAKYYKGLGSWNAELLSELMIREGIEKFFVPFNMDDEANETILNWFVNDRVGFRKQKLMENEFDIGMV